MVEKRYVQIVDAKNRVRVRFKKDRGRIVDFVVQYETLIKGDWRPIVRYDTAHGQPHTDIFRSDGTTGEEIATLPQL